VRPGVLADGASRRFFAAHAQSCLGSGFAHVALPLLAFDKTGSPWAVTAVLVADLLPAIALGPVLGTLVDRIGWRTCAIAADVLRALAFAVLAFSAPLPVMVIATAMAGIGTALFTPAGLAGLGHLAAGERRPAAVGLFGACDDIGMTAGPALAALVLAGLPAAVLLGANAVTFAVSAVLLAGIRGVPLAGGARDLAHDAVGSFLRDVRAGLQELMRGRPEVRTLLLSSTAAVLCVGVTNVGEVLLAREVFDVGGPGLAILVAAAGLGTVLGSLAARSRTTWEWRRGYTTGLSCMAADLLLCAIAPSFWLIVPVFVLGGFGNGFALVHDRLLLSEAVPPELHGRVFGLQKTLTSLAFAVSFAGASALIALEGVQNTFLIAGLAMLFVLAGTVPRLRTAWPSPPQPGPAGVAA
jgi:MFS family permease